MGVSGGNAKRRDEARFQSVFVVGRVAGVAQIDKPEKHASLWWLLGIAFILAVAAYFFVPGSFGDRLSVTGLVISVASLVVAVRIFFRQDRDSKDAQQKLGKQFSTIELKLESLAEGTVVPDEADQDAWPEEMQAISELAIGGTDSDARVLSREQIPLQVVADLVKGWEADSLSGNWTVSSLIGASRRIVGRGNPSWYLATVDPEDKKIYYWRLSKGGRAKLDPTVVLEDSI